MGDPATKEKDEECEETLSCRTPDFCNITASPSSPAASHAAKRLTDKETKSGLCRNRTKSRVKSSSRRMFLDNSLSDEEAAGDTEGGNVINAPSSQNWGGHQAEGAENGGSGLSERDPLLISQSPTPENSWMCPLTLDDIEESSSPGPVSESSRPSKSAVRSSNCSGVILKLRRMFGGGVTRKKARYQAISDSGTFADPSLSRTDDGEGEASGEADLLRSTPKVTHRWQRTASFPRALRPRRSSSKRKLRSLLKIKYCPYLSACHSAEHRRRWVLRSAVQRARRAMRFYYPDLVGKRIRHLYEEDDKSEVWYRGEVLRIHEAHNNPLKTIFEVRYDSEPEWKYYLELLIDYKKGWLKIED